MDKKIKQIIQAVLDLSESEIQPALEFPDYTFFDSLKHINLVAALEDEFNISLSDDEISSCTNYKNIVNIITKKKSD